jgi:hypothetical protein
VARCSGLSRGSRRRSSIATPRCGGQRPQSRRQGPGWRHERHSAAPVSRERIGSRASLGVGSEDPARQGREHGKGPHEWKLLWVTDDGPLHGWDGRSSLGGCTALASPGHVQACAGWEAGVSGVHDGSDRGDIFARPKSLRMHRSGCGVVKRFILSRVESLRAQTW